MWSPGWAWLILTVFIVLFVVVFDVHAAMMGTETMTGRMRDWIFNAVTGPFIIAGWVGIFAGLMWHFITRRQ